MFWTDLGGNISLEAVGKIDRKYKTVSYWAKPVDESEDKRFGKGLVFYVDEKKGQIVGVLLFNLFENAGKARKIVDDRLSENSIPLIIRRFDLFE
jgi:hypothetical protein